MKIDAALRKLFKLTDTGYDTDAQGRICSIEVTHQADAVLAKLQPFDGLAEFESSAYLVPGSTPNDLSGVGLHLLAGAKDLKKVSLYRCDPKRISPDDFKVLTSLPKLERLETQYEGDMDEAMKYIGNIAHLRILAVNATKSLTDRGLQYVPKLQSLERLDICNTAVPDAGMKYIAQLPNLKELSMDEDDISDEGLKEIGKLHQLRSLVLSGPRITDKGVETLHELRNLRFICLAKTHITDKSMEWIGSLKDIETVFVVETEVTDAGIAHLMGKPHLDFVVLDKTRVTAEGAHKLEESLKANHAEVSHESIIPDD